MSTLNNKWLKSLYVEKSYLLIGLITLSLIGSAALGFFTPRVIADLYEAISAKNGIDDVARQLVFIFIFEYLTLVIYQLCISKYIQRLLGKIRLKSYKDWMLTYESVGVGSFGSHNYPLGEVIARILNDTEAVIEMVSSGSFRIFIDFAFIISCLVSFIALNTVSGIALIIAEVSLCCALYYGSKKMVGVYMEVRNSTGKLNRVIADISSGLRYSFYTPNNRFASFKSNIVSEEFLKKQLRANVWDASYFAVAESLFPILLALLVLVVPYSNIVEVALIAAIIDLIQRSITPIKEATSRISSIQRAKTGLMRIQEFNDDLDSMPKSGLENKNERVEDFKSLSVSIDKFTYPKKDNEENQFELKKINFTAMPGNLIGIVGMSGSGKSTVLKILSTQIIAMDFKIDIKYADELISYNQNSKSSDVENYRRQVSIVSQDSHVFTDTLEFNITFSDETCKNFEVFWNDILIQIPYIKKWGVGPKSKINVKDISLGQKQLISALRSCYLSKPIVLFDEISSGLDSELELALRKLVMLIQKKSLTIIVAHRIETIKEANTILVMENGSLIQSGTHDELIGNNKVYQDFVSQVTG